jgi:hypothetical protein
MSGWGLQFISASQISKWGQFVLQESSWTSFFSTSYVGIGPSEPKHERLVRDRGRGDIFLIVSMLVEAQAFLSEKRRDEFYPAAAVDKT